MARQRTSEPQEEPELSLKAPKSKAQELIARAIDEAEELLRRANDAGVDGSSLATWTQDAQRWDARSKAALEFVFDGPFPTEFHRAATGGLFRQVGQTATQTFAYRQAAIARAINTLRSIDERLEFLDEPQGQEELRPHTPGGRQVFVVHGHDELLREQVERILSRLGLDPLILSEQTDRGRTIIEKFEDHALDVGFAVVLLTADDFGHGASEGPPEHPNRARQNVILELGYFMGALGRSRVAALSSSHVEKPSDIHGVLYIPVDQNWELRLAREIRDAGLPVDLNAL